MRMHRLAALGLSLVLMLGLTACQLSLETFIPPESPILADPDPVVPQEDPSLTQLRETLTELDSPCGIAFLGQLSESTDLDTLLESSGLLADYPFLADLPPEQIVTHQGSEVYCLVPRCETATLMIQDLYFEEDSSQGQSGTILYQGSGDPVLLVCNVSDVVPNTTLLLTDESNQLSYSPTRNACDGSVFLPVGSKIHVFADSASSIPPVSDEDAAVPEFVGDWNMLDTIPTGDTVYCEISFLQDGTLTYRCGYPNTEWSDILEGTYYVVTNSSEYPEGSLLLDLTSTMHPDAAPLWGVFTPLISNGQLALTHITGDPLLVSTESRTLHFLSYIPATN